jgi:NhaP-type Na+/H+ or K+/H+ antiporter
MDRIRSSPEVSIMEMLLLGMMIGFIVGYPTGLFIDKLDKREKAKSGGR